MEQINYSKITWCVCKGIIYAQLIMGFIGLILFGIIMCTNSKSNTHEDFNFEETEKLVIDTVAPVADTVAVDILL